MRTMRRIVGVIGVGLLAVPAIAQEPGSSQDAVAEYGAWVDVMVELTRNVEFEEADVRAFLDHWAGMESLGLEGRLTGPGGFQGRLDALLTDSAYLAWAAENGLDAESWMRRSMRIATVLLRDEMQGQRHEIDSQRAEAEAMIEQQCAQLDADSCKAMREMMMGALAMSSAMLEGLDRIPPPSAAEAALLERYANELRQVVGD